MSKISFANYPPVGLVPSFKLGDWVKDKPSGGYGTVEALCLTGDVKVKWSTGEWTEESTSDLLPASAAQYLGAIQEFATRVLGMEISQFKGHHLTVAGDNDVLSLDTLSALEEKLLSLAPIEVDGDYDATWDTIEETAKQLDATEEVEEEDDIFAAFGLEAETEGKSAQSAHPADGTPAAVVENCSPATTSRVTVGADPYHSGFFAIFVDGEIQEQFFETEEDAREHIDDWEETLRLEAEEAPAPAATAKATKPAKEKPVCAKCFNVSVNKLSPEWNGVKVCKKCHLEAGEAPKSVDAVETSVSTTVEATAPTATGTCETSGDGSDPKLQNPITFSTLARESIVQSVINQHNTGLVSATTSGGLNDPKLLNQSGTVADATDTQDAVSTTAQAAQIAEELVREIIAGNATKEDDTQPVNAVTDAGLIDPETGEVLEPSFILRKLGWTELPVLSKTPTHQELEAFEEKLDQVLDRVSSHQEKAARYRAACEKRCAPYDSAAKFWDEQFIKPMSKMLAPFKLKQNSKGEYKSKTMVLPSGCIKFTKSGGAFVHDEKLVKAYIQEHGVENFESIGAKMEAVYSYRKLVAALAKGTLKDIPGTGIRETNHFATAKVVSPVASGNTSEEEGEEGEE